jgi:hypothetical protein
VALTRGGGALLAPGLVRPTAGDWGVGVRGIARGEGFFVGAVVGVIVAVPEERVVRVHHLGQRLPEGGLHIIEGDPVLRAARPGEARLDRVQSQIQDLREARLGRLVRAPEALLLAVSLDQRDEFLLAARATQVAERLGVHGEERASRPELGGHVRDGGPVGERELAQALAVELHELAHDAVRAEHLGDGKDEVRGRDALLEGACQLETYNLGDEHVVGLAQGHGLRLDAPHAPAEHAEAVDHGGVAVGPDERIGHRHSIFDDHAFSQVLQVDLVDDPGRGRYDREVVEGLLAPLQELVALAVALELPFGVELQCHGRAERVDLHRVVYNQIGRHERVDPARVPPYVRHRAAHRREVDDSGHPGKVLHDDPGRQIRKLPTDRLRPVGQRLDVLFRDEISTGIAQEGLQHYADGERKREHVSIHVLIQHLQAVEFYFSRTSLQRRARTEGIIRHVCNLSLKLVGVVLFDYR